MSMKKGVSRGIFSNEAGLGTGSIAHACADTRKPVKQNLRFLDLLPLTEAGYRYLRPLQCAALHFLRSLDGDFMEHVVWSSCLVPAQTDHL